MQCQINCSRKPGNKVSKKKVKLIFLKWTKTHQKKDQNYPNENLTTDEYQCNRHGDLGPKDGFLELSIGSRVEEARS